ncbi:MAG TPA: helix-turn-helix transcriptional regulator, partial [Clostridia bacterium]|nr:helix-turn-helix transcriptional regulator [Clostridia bacterium]
MQELTKEEKLKAAEQLAAHLSALRKAAGLTQEEFGARAGLSRRRISLIESGGYKPSW